MSEPTIECTRTKACRWKGRQNGLIKKLNKKMSKATGIDMYDCVCPKCGCKTTYDIKAGKQG